MSPDQNNPETFFVSRVKKCIIFFTVWLAAVIFMLIMINFNRQKYLDFGNKIAMQTKNTFPIRAKIRDKNLKPLAWTEIYFDLHLKKIPMDFKYHELLKKIEALAPGKLASDIDFTEGELLISNLNPENLEEFYLLSENYPVKITPRYERIKINLPQLQSFIGSVKNNEGITGLEKTYNEKLKGEAGSFTVMLDRNQNWIVHSIKILKSATQGKDIILPYGIDELLLKIPEKMETD